MIADNQIKWALKYAKDMDEKDYESAEVIALVLEALKFDLFPATEPSFNEHDLESVNEIIELMPDKNVINRVKSEISILEVKQ